MNFISNIIGSSVSKIFDENNVTKVTEIAHETTGSFMREFPYALHDVIIQDMITEKITPAMKPAPMASVVIKKGYLLKQGAQVKNWKNRTFIAMNEEDNFEIIYGEEDQGVFNEKGRINCFAYSVVIFSPEDEKKFGPHGFKLINLQHDDRTWYLRAETDKEVVEWMEIFSNACNKTAQVDFQTPFELAVFKRSCRTVRASYGYYGKVQITGSPVDMLQRLVSQVIHREFLDDHIRQNFKNGWKGLDVKAIEKESEKIAKPSCTSSWRHCENSLLSRSHFELLVKNDLPEIIRVEESLRSSIEDKLSDIVDPLLADLEEKMTTILEAINDSMASAYSAALNGFCDDMNSRCTTMMATAKARAKTIANSLRIKAEMEEAREKRMKEKESERKALDEASASPANPSSPRARARSKSAPGTVLNAAVAEMKAEEAEVSVFMPDPFNLKKTFGAEMTSSAGALELFRSGQLKNAQVLLWKMFSEDLEAVRNVDILQTSTLTGHGCYILVMDDVRTLVRNATCLFKTEALPGLMNDDLTGHEDEQLSQWKEIMRKILPLFAEDAKRNFKNVTLLILQELLETILQEAMLVPTAAVIMDLDEQIPKKFRRMLKITFMAERWVRHMVDEFLQILINRFCTRANNIIDDGLREAFGTLDSENPTPAPPRKKTIAFTEEVNPESLRRPSDTNWDGNPFRGLPRDDSVQRNIGGT
jgi:hypothetical protein